MCSPKPPKPDPLIGQAAKQNADIALEFQRAARDDRADVVGTSGWDAEKHGCRNDPRQQLPSHGVLLE